MFKSIIRVQRKFFERHAFRVRFQNISGIISTAERILKENRHPTFLEAHYRNDSTAVHSTTVEELMPYFYDLVQELTSMNDPEMKDFASKYHKLLTYTVPTGKRIRARATVTAYKVIESIENLTPENIRSASILGWCVELFAASFLIADDILDASIQRRGAPCWYLFEKTAIADSLILQESLYHLLRKHFSNHQCYVSIMELFHCVTQNTTFGQSLDMMKVPNENGLDTCTIAKYGAIVKYKTIYYSIELPVRLAIHLARKCDYELYKPVIANLSKMGYFLQAQNDFLDCFGNSSFTGKDGTDIQEGKCTWLLVTALQRATPSQKKNLESNYGKLDLDSITAVRSLYEELKLPEIYNNYEKEIIDLIQSHRNKAVRTLPDILFCRISEIACKNISNYNS